MKIHVLLLIVAVLLAPLGFLLSNPDIDATHYSSVNDYAAVESITVQKLIRMADGEYLNVNEAGFDSSATNTKPLLIFLHGYPETGLTCWKHQITHFAKLGYRVVAPDNRGFNTSSKRDASSLTAAEDVRTLIGHYGEKSAVIIGHDWGGATAWYFAAKYPELTHKLIVLNAPHGIALRRHAPLIQVLRSWYMFFFQIPSIPEWKLARNDWSFLINFGFGSSNKGSFSLEDLRRYREAWSQPGAASAMLAWYRTAFTPTMRKSWDAVYGEGGIIKPPVLLIWGENDKYLDIRNAHATIPAFTATPESRLAIVSNASHWVTHDQPERVNQLIAEFIA